MKIKLFTVILCLFAPLIAIRNSIAMTPEYQSDAAERPFIFIENNTDNNFFVTPDGTLDPRITGSNRWTGLKYTGSGIRYQQSLGYIDDGYNRTLRSGNKFDMWLTSSPVAYPLTGLRCINWYSGCDMNTSLIPPQATDANGFYGATVTSGGLKWMHGMMADSFYQYIQQLPVGGSVSMEINSCQTSDQYNASAGGRCKYQNNGSWHVRKVTHTKVSHLRLLNTNAMMEVFVNSDGVPILGEGNVNCRMQTIGSRSGISCKMVSYSLMTSGADNDNARIFPSISNAALESAINRNDMQFSLDGNSWKSVSGNTSYYTLSEMEKSQDIHIFLSSDFFKKMIVLGIGNSDVRDLFNIRFRNTRSPESGWYEFSVTNTLLIKPRDFGVSIISNDFNLHPTRSGTVGRNEPDLEFGYIVTTSGKTAADEVSIKVTGGTSKINSRSYCLFNTVNNIGKIPFPAKLSFVTKWGPTVEIDNGCDGLWYNMTSALWKSTPWSDISGDIGTMNKTNVKFSIPMNDPISERTIDNQDWVGLAYASGEIHVKATWRNIK